MKVVFTKLQPKITSFTVFVLMNNSSIIFSNTGRLSGGGTKNPGTLSGRTELMTLSFLVAPGIKIPVPGNIPNKVRIHSTTSTGTRYQVGTPVTKW